MPPRRREIPPESSWRLVDGENDSFDTSIIDPPPLDDDMSPPSSAMPSSGLPTQSFSQSMSSVDSSAGFGSQDSIRDFANFQHDPDVILREPFRPTIPSSVATSQRTSYPRPDMQFRMPLVEANNIVASEASRSARTADEDTEEGSVWDEREGLIGDDPYQRDWVVEEELDRLSKEQYKAEANGNYGASSGSPTSSSSGRLLRVLRFAAIPAAIAMAAYLIHSNGVSLDVARQSFSLKSLREIPSVSNFQMPFFFEAESSSRPTASTSFIDFTSLMEVQSGFESVLDKTTQGLAMPRELKESEMITRNIRSLLKTSEEDASSEDLLSELNSYIEKVGRAAAAMQTFHIHVGSTVDSVININRWTLRHINSLSVEQAEAPSLPPIMAWAIRPLSVIFRSSSQDGNDKALWNKYSEHVILVQDRLDKLLEEGKALSLLLHQGEAHLSAINEQAERRLSSSSLSKSKSGGGGSSFLSSVWAYIGRFVEEKNTFREEVALLKKVDAQYAATISHLLSLMENLKDIQAYLGDLLKRDASSSSVVWGDEAAGSQQQAQSTTLSEQYEIIKSALERLERAREKAAEGEAQVEEAGSHGGGAGDERAGYADAEMGGDAL
ncbi:uncharacterized protein TRIREDRAFT_108866 [Trichoderma reesei QM6a]|jgi:hypothetical protein|uniref:Predicted protein n=2 Tax=Hypocrea jecorina TaxID=51453 RepID=G0RMY7_HYPJQ|nr:uncharacterized protein TRIREDRAFT_108866 [Trichoderma reesei QM6a]EGR47567.1 predicted protein [Trichoderma reesei QM6a]ETS00845.1 hypothetical protein M419DRAFT_82456 [Trichoderma reesei RUT C-30]